MSTASIFILLEVNGSLFCFTCSYRFFDSRTAYSKTPSELNKYISLLHKNNFFSLNPLDFSYEVFSISKTLSYRSSIRVVLQNGKNSQEKYLKSSQLVNDFRRGIDYIHVLDCIVQSLRNRQKTSKTVSTISKKNYQKMKMFVFLNNLARRMNI